MRMLDYFARIVAISAFLTLYWGATGQAQSTAAKSLVDDFEADLEGDCAPDDWYNMRDAKLAAEGGKKGPAFLAFRNELPGRPARASRAFELDGREVEAMLISLWVRIGDGLKRGERLGEEPRLMVDCLGEDVQIISRGAMGPWSGKEFRGGWCKVSKRISVPSRSRHGILTVGLLGATGELDVDGLNIEFFLRGGSRTADLVVNGDFERGDLEPDSWELSSGASRVFPGNGSDSCLRMEGTGSTARSGLGQPVRGVTALRVGMAAQGTGLRGMGAAAAATADLAFLDRYGAALPGVAGRLRLFRWAGSFPWKAGEITVAVPAGAHYAVVELSKTSAEGSLHIDQVRVTSSPEPSFAAWAPYHEEEDTTRWFPFEPAGAIEPGSALDFSFLLAKSEGGPRRVVAQGGHLIFEETKERARFHGVSLIPPAALQEASQADSLAERLARSGVNLVRLSGLDIPIGPGNSLLDDLRDDTRVFDAAAIQKLDHLMAALFERGIHVSLELQGGRWFRSGDGVPAYGELPPGGGAAAAFSPVLREKAQELGGSLLSHVNTETKKALRDEAGLAWVSLAGELSLFDLLEGPSNLPEPYREELVELARQSPRAQGRLLWRALESEQWSSLAESLREVGLKAPVAGSSHWRREDDFVAAQSGSSLNLIDDRLYWTAPRWVAPDRRSLLFEPGGDLAAFANRKRRGDRPYVVGEWAERTAAGSSPCCQSADFLLAAGTAAANDWDALVRRGVAIYPRLWGASATGTGGGPDLFTVPESINGDAAMSSLLPHSASIVLRPRTESAGGRPQSTRVMLSPGWLSIQTPYTCGLAGWTLNKKRSMAAETVAIETESDFAVVAVSSAEERPLETSSRLLVTAVARAMNTGLRWSDAWRLEIADPGESPMLREPVTAQIRWKFKGKVSAYALSSSGHRNQAVAVASSGDHHVVECDPASRVIHWELVGTPE